MTITVPDSFDRQVLTTDLDHVEAVCWDQVRKCLWAGGEAGQIYKILLDGAVSVEVEISGGVLLGIAIDVAGDLFICDPGNHCVWQLSEGSRPKQFGDDIDYPNYPAFGPDGRLFVSDSGSFSVPSGRVLAVDPAGSTAEVTDRRVAYANGLAVDGERLWVVESGAPGVSAMPVGGGPLEMVVEMERCVPDGLALDGDGGLLISCYQPNQLWRWSETDALELVLDDWSGESILSPTNVAFCGEQFERLALASLCGHDLVTIRWPHAGAPVQYPFRMGD